MAKREQIDNLIVDLIAIKEFSKDIHYTCHGEAFFAKHLLVDKFDFNESIDLLKECCLLGNDERPLPSEQYMERAVSVMIIPDDTNDKKNFDTLLELLNSTLDEIDSMVGLTKADENVIGGIAQDLQQYKGLVNLQLEE